MTRSLRPILSLALAAASTLLMAFGCGGETAQSSGNCDADVPESWACRTSLAVEQSECQSDALSSDSETFVTATADGHGVMISGGHFRCAQEVCAYLDESAETPRLLLQPCDMNPSSVAKCDCLYGLEVDVDVPAEGLDVYTRFDNVGGEKEPTLVGTVPAEEGATPQRLCDGSSHLTFATLTAGGNLNGVPRVAAEVGWSFLLIDGQCRYWAMSGPEGEVRTGTLDADEEAEISEAFLLGHWDELAGQENEGCADAPYDYFRFHDDMRGAVCWTHELTEAVPAWHERLFDAGTPLDGAVRCTLADATESAWAMTMPEIGLSWSLAEDPAALAVGRMEDENSDVEPRVATGEDAAALRALRASYAENQPASGLGPWLRVPVVHEEDGAEARYIDLALRDVSPFEVDGELDVDAFFE